MKRSMGLLAEVETVEEVPEHLLRLGGGWNIWRKFCLRGAGFPATLVTRLVDARLSWHADVLRHAEAQRDARLEATLDACARLSEGKESRRAASRIAQKLKRSSIPEVDEGSPLASDLRRLREAAAEVERAEQDFARAYEAARRQSAVALREIAGEPRFREAVTWQTRHAANVALEGLVHTSVDATDKRTRQRELLVARYVQRYAVKNDTVGYFGPVAYGTFDTGVAAIRVDGGATALARRTVCLTPWALNHLAQVISRIDGVKHWMPPRLSPMYCVSGTELVSPFGAQALSGHEAKVLGRCRGDLSTQQIADEVGVSHELVLDVVRAAELQGRVLWGVLVPVAEDYDTDAPLRRALRRIEDQEVWRRASRVLTRVTDAKDKLTAAAGAGPERVNDALDELESVFAEITSQSPTRNPGQTYGVRTIVQEYCRRDLDVDLGRSILDALRGPMSLLMTSLRWANANMARAYLSELAAAHRQVATMMGTERVPLFALWPSIQGIFMRTSGEAPPSVQSVTTRLRETWAELLGVRDRGDDIQISSATLRPEVERRFAAGAPGVPSARYYSPDIMLAASDEDAVRRGEFRVVLGEIHAYLNTLEQAVFFRDIDDPAAVRRWVEADMPHGRFVLAALEGQAGSTVSRHPLDGALEHANGVVSQRPSTQVFSVAELEVVVIEGELYVSTRDGRRRWSVLHALDGLSVTEEVSILPSAPVEPRVTIDNVVVLRKKWRFDRAALSFIDGRTPFQRYLMVRRWAEKNGLPDLIFYAAASEKKPAMLALDSVHLAEAFVKTAAASPEVSLTEMLPTPDQCWLRDAAGSPYTTEFRLVIVDGTPYRPGPHSR